MREFVVKDGGTGIMGSEKCQQEKDRLSTVNIKCTYFRIITTNHFSIRYLSKGVNDIMVKKKSSVYNRRFPSCISPLFQSES